MNQQELIDILTNIPPFNRLKEKSLEELAGLCQIHEYQNRQIIYREGDTLQKFYLLVEGRLAVLTTQDGADREIEIIKRGTAFGVISLFTGDPHSVTVHSIENSVVAEINPEEFKAFLKKHPSLSLDFSQILSQRVKSRTSRPKLIFRSKRIGVLGFNKSGKSVYLVNLGRGLRKQSGKKVICLEINSSSNFSLPGLLNRELAPFPVENFRETEIEKYIVNDNGVDYLLVQAESGSRFYSILNFLSENYHFVVCELSCRLLNDAFYDFIYRADVLHLLFLARRVELVKGGVFIRDLKSRAFVGEEKLKVIVNEYAAEAELLYDKEARIINHPIYGTLPDKKSPEYDLAVRRISRQTAEVVTGVALGSGGSYGFAHIGVLQVLEENNIPVDMVCGSSMGSLVAAMWACGFSIDQMKGVARKFGKQLNLYSFPGFYFPFKGIIKAKRMERIYRKIFGDRTFHDLKRGLKLASFDFFTRKAAVIEEGLIYKAVAASCAIPGVFEPIQFNKKLMLDGGILNPLPSKILLNYNAHKIIAVNVTPPRESVAKVEKPKGKWNVLDFVFGSIETMQRQFIEEAIKISDVVIHPIFDATDWAQFERVDEFIETGRQAALGKIDEIKQLVAE